MLPQENLDFYRSILEHFESKNINVWQYLIYIYSSLKTMGVELPLFSDWGAITPPPTPLVLMPVQHTCILKNIYEDNLADICITCCQLSTNSRLMCTREQGCLLRYCLPEVHEEVGMAVIILYSRKYWRELNLAVESQKSP